MVSDLFLIHVGTSLHNWLNYVSAVERGYVLSENSIIYPVSEFIGTKANANEIWLDRAHPDLKGKRLDLRFNTMLDRVSCEVALEFKYVRQNYTETPSEQQRILNDLLRLKIFAQSGINRKAYFLICGEQIDFLKAFESIGWTKSVDDFGRPLPTIMSIEDIKDLGTIKPQGFYTNWFKFDPALGPIDKLTEVEIKDTNTVPTELLEGFYEEYENSFKSGMDSAKLESTKIQTRLVYMSDLNNLEVVKKLMRVAIWQISSK